MTSKTFTAASSNFECDTENVSSKKGKLLLNAAKKGDFATVQKLIGQGLPLFADFLGMTPLHYAAQHGHLDICDLILNSGITHEIRSKVEKTPLHLASFNGHESICLLLIANGADVNAQDLIYMTPLHWAVEKGYTKVVQLLLQNGADVKFLNKFEKSPLDLAIENNFLEIACLLEEGPYTGDYTITPNDPLITLDSFAVSSENPVLDNNLETVCQTNSDSPEDTELLSKQENITQKAALSPNTLELLEKHGLEILTEEDDVNMVASAVDSGQTVILTEAGRQALNMTKAQSVSINRSRPIILNRGVKRKQNELLQINCLNHTYNKLLTEAHYFDNLAQQRRKEALRIKRKIILLEKNLRS